MSALSASGCPDSSPPRPEPPSAEKSSSRPLVLLVADDPPLGKAIAREWRGHTEEELTVRDVSLAELAKASRLPGDAVVFPSGWMGQLAERELIVPLESAALEAPQFDHRDIFDALRLREMRWGGRTMAAPLGSPQLLLCYRKDLFESHGLSPPTDWQAYSKVVEHFAHASGDAAIRPTSEPLADGWAGQLLLARAAGYAMHRDQVSPLFALGTAEPLIDRPPFVRALEELVAAAKEAEMASHRAAPAEAFLAVRRGSCAMAVCWPPTTMPTEAALQEDTKGGILAFAPLPTSRQAYRFATSTWEDRDQEDTSPIPLLSVAGRMVGVSASSHDARRASGFALWLAGSEVSQQVAPSSPGTTLFRHSQVAKSGRWTPLLAPGESRQYAETLAAVLSSGRAMPGLTIPLREDYLAALDQAVNEALSGKPALEALQGAAGRWRKISENLGAAVHRRAILSSLSRSKAASGD